MSKYAQYSHIEVQLEDVLSLVDELLDQHMRALLRVDEDATDASAKQQIGRAQGLHTARQKLEYAFGIQDGGYDD